MANEYMPSGAVQAAAAAVEEQKNRRPGEYQSAWDAQLNEAMQRILNREPFQYNLNGDALYRQYKDQAIRTGRLAMMDTMGQAAALTGGYGSSYSQNAGQQAYQQSLASLNDRIPELYQLALDQYRQSGADLMAQYNLLSGRENQDYGRYQDSLSAWQRDADRLWAAYNDERGFDYDAYRHLIEDEQWRMEFEENKRRYDQEWEEKHKKKKKEPVVVYVPKPTNPTPPTPPTPPDNPVIRL